MEYFEGHDVTMLSYCIGGGGAGGAVVKHEFRSIWSLSYGLLK